MLRRAAPALGGFVAVRVLGLLTLLVAAAATGRSGHARLVRWDAQWYAGVAAHGYGFTRLSADGRRLSDLAFFPLLPWLERLVAAVTGLSDVNAGLVVSALCSLAAALALFAVAERVHDRRTGTVLVLLWAAVPIGIVESMAYSEALFTALAGWALYCVLDERWLTAGVLSALAGLTRPVGLAVATAVVVAALVALRRNGPRWDVVAGLLLAPLGWLGYVAWVGVRQGTSTAYFRVAGRWGNSFDGGAAFARWTWGYLDGGGVLLGVLLVLAVVVLLVLLGLLVHDREPLPLVTFAVVVVAMTLTTSGYFGSKPRYLLPAFPLLLPIAGRLARWRVPGAATLLAALVAGSAAYGAIWLLGPGPP